MASTMHNLFATSCTPSPLPTDEELNLYHSIDRHLYMTLIFELGRNMAESMNVMALWLWLEQQSTGGMTLVKRISSLPPVLINDLADETAACLRCVEKDKFSYPENAYELSLLPNMLGKNVTLKFLYEHRIGVLRGVSMMFSEVCSRAFRDINQISLAGFEAGPSMSFGGFEAGPSIPFGRFEAGPSIPFGRFEAGPSIVGSVRPVYSAGGLVFPQAREGVWMQQSPVVNDELSEIFSHNLNLQEEENNVTPDERTIFLTFSRGYPLSEAEVWAFFTRKFGDFIEEIQMQEVPAGEQVLYARVVARAGWMIDAVVGGGRAKYNINGKHVWARKFVKKNRPSSSSSSVVTTAQSSRRIVPRTARR